MQSLFNYLSTNYYTDLISFISAILALTIILKRTKDQNLERFKYYIAGYITIKTLEYITYISKDFHQAEAPKILIQAHNIGDTIFTIFEFFCFSTYLREYSHKMVYRISTSTFYIATIVLLTLSFIQKDLISNRHQLYNYQAILLFVLTCSYFIKLFQSNRSENCAKEPHFWVSSGLLIFTSSTLPFSLMSNYIWLANQSTYSHLFSMFFVFYSLLFLMLAKAFLCR